jgi:hypothetical protein
MSSRRYALLYELLGEFLSEMGRQRRVYEEITWHHLGPAALLDRSEEFLMEIDYRGGRAWAHADAPSAQSLHHLLATIQSSEETLTEVSV